MVSQGDLVKATLKKLSKKTHKQINEVIAEKGAKAATAFLGGIIRSKTGLDVEKSAVIAGVVVKKSVKVIRDNLKNK